MRGRVSQRESESQFSLHANSQVENGFDSIDFVPVFQPES
jgi:hypothetical protein